MKYHSNQLIIAIILITCFVNACQNNNKTEQNTDSIKSNDTLIIHKDSTILPKIPTKKNYKILSIQETGSEILKLLKSKQYAKIEKFIHPVDGLYFSPYATIDTNADINLNRKDYIKFLNNKKELHWGSYMGSGDSIKLALTAYLLKFVYNADYLNAEKISINKSVAKGNSINNIKEIYPHQYYIEYHFSGLDKKNKGMDWCSLRMVFKKYHENYYIVSLIHDQWTI